MSSQQRRLLFDKNTEESSDSSEDSSEERILEYNNNLQKSRVPVNQGSTNNSTNGKNTMFDKLDKVESLLVKFNGLDKLTNLIEIFTKNLKVLDNLKIKNFDNLQELTNLKKLDGLSAVYEGLGNLKLLEELNRLNELEELEKLKKLDVFDDDRINELFVNLKQVIDKLNELKTNDRLNDIISKTDIVMLSLKPFREQNYANRMLELPTKLNSDLITIMEGSKLYIKEMLDKLPNELKDILKSNQNTAQPLEEIKEILYNINQENQKNVPKDTIEEIVRTIRKTESTTPNKVSVEFPDELVKHIKSLEITVNRINQNVTDLTKQNAQLSDLTLIEQSINKKIEELPKINGGNLEKLVNITNSKINSIEESVGILKKNVSFNEALNSIFEFINLNNDELKK